MVEKEKIIEESQILYTEIDSCITELLGARTTHNSEEEGKALFRMEGLMVGVLQHLSCIINSLQEETPEPYTGKYDEAYLQEKIAKATKSWEGVDVDKYMDEVRGRGEKDTPELEEEVKSYFQGYWPGTETVEQCNTDLHFTPPAIIRLARHFAEWGAEHLKK